MLEGAQAVFLGDTGLKMHFSGTQPASLFWCRIFAWGSTIITWGRGAQAVIWGDTDPK